MEIGICSLLVFLSAFIFFTKAAAAFNLDEIKALAEQGNFKAQYQLALMYEDGDEVKQDYAQAVYWHRQAAEQGYDWSQFNLALMYSKGRGIKQDSIQAVAWYRKAAEQGHPYARHNLAAMYADGRGVQQDDVQAIYWYRKAAEREISDLQYDLGTLYEQGRDSLIKQLGYVFYYYSFQHRLLPDIFLSGPERILKDLEHPEIVLSRFLKIGFENEKWQDKFNDKEKLRAIEKCMEKPHWLFSVCIDYVQLNLGKKFVLEKHSYPDIDVFILKFLEIDTWSQTLCERIYFVSNKEHSRFAFYTVELGARNTEKSLFGRVSVESDDMGEFMICGHTKDGKHVNYGTAPIGEEAISTKIFDLFSRAT